MFLGAQGLVHVQGAAQGRGLTRGPGHAHAPTRRALVEDARDPRAGLVNALVQGELILLHLSDFYNIWCFALDFIVSIFQTPSNWQSVYEFCQPRIFLLNFPPQF